MKIEKTQQALDKLCEMIKTEKRVKFMIVNNPMLMRKDLGQYHRDTRQIRMRNIEDKDEFLSVLAHEFTHFWDYEIMEKSESPHTTDFFSYVIQFKELLNYILK